MTKESGNFYISLNKDYTINKTFLPYCATFDNDVRGEYDIVRETQCLFNVRWYSLDQSDKVIVSPILIQWNNIIHHIKTDKQKYRNIHDVIERKLTCFWLSGNNKQVILIWFLAHVM